jgi:hypothetical protein
MSQLLKVALKVCPVSDRTIPLKGNEIFYQTMNMLDMSLSKYK